MSEEAHEQSGEPTEYVLDLEDIKPGRIVSALIQIIDEAMPGCEFDMEAFGKLEVSGVSTLHVELMEVLDIVEAEDREPMLVLRVITDCYKTVHHQIIGRNFLVPLSLTSIPNNEDLHFYMLREVSTILDSPGTRDEILDRLKRLQYAVWDEGEEDN